MKKIRFILNAFIAITTALAIIWLIGAFLAWDIAWPSRLGIWAYEERAGLGFGISMLSIVILGVLLMQEAE